MIFGSAARAEQMMHEPDLRDAVLRDCALLTPEIAMNWDVMEPNAGRFDFAPLDALAQFCRQHELKLRGHNLIWDKATPGWALRALSAGDGWSVVEAHMTAVMTRYRRQVHEWIVVNEAIDVGGRSDGLREWAMTSAFGADYVARAFELARDLAAGGALLINEFGLEYGSDEEARRRDALLALLKRLVRSGAPIDGVGLQAHLDLSKGDLDARGVDGLIREIGDLGLYVTVTEFDVKEHDYVAPAAERDRRVGQAAQAYLDLVLRHPHVLGVTTWGLSDRHSWLLVTPEDRARFPGAWQDGTDPGFNRGLPYDGAFTTKPMWDAIAASLDQAPHRPAPKTFARAPRRRIRD